MIILTLIILAIDICSKLVVSKSLYVGESIKVIDNFFSITYVKNTGAAWSIFADKGYFVMIVSIIIILGLVWYVYKNRPKDRLEKIAYSLIIGGAIGNLIDRIVYGYVIDFLDFNLFGWNYPIFNMADTFIVIGVILLMILTWRCSCEGNKSN